VFEGTTSKRLLIFTHLLQHFDCMFTPSNRLFYNHLLTPTSEVSLPTTAKCLQRGSGGALIQVACANLYVKCLQSRICRLGSEACTLTQVNAPTHDYAEPCNIFIHGVGLRTYDVFLVRKECGCVLWISKRAKAKTASAHDHHI